MKLISDRETSSMRQSLRFPFHEPLSMCVLVTAKVRVVSPGLEFPGVLHPDFRSQPHTESTVVAACDEKGVHSTRAETAYLAYFRSEGVAATAFLCVLEVSAELVSAVIRKLRCATCYVTVSAPRKRLSGGRPRNEVSLAESARCRVPRGQQQCEAKFVGCQRDTKGSHSNTFPLSPSSKAQTRHCFAGATFAPDVDWSRPGFDVSSCLPRSVEHVLTPSCDTTAARSRMGVVNWCHNRSRVARQRHQPWSRDPCSERAAYTLRCSFHVDSCSRFDMYNRSDNQTDTTESLLNRQ